MCLSLAAVILYQCRNAKSATGFICRLVAIDEVTVLEMEGYGKMYNVYFKTHIHLHDIHKKHCRESQEHPTNLQNLEALGINQM